MSKLDDPENALRGPGRNRRVLHVCARASYYFFRYLVPNGRREVWDATKYDWCRELEQAHPEVKAEVLDLLEHPDQIPGILDIADANEQITYGNGWKVFMFYFAGDRVGFNCERCPRTAEALSRVPYLVNAMFSVLSSQQRIQPHRAPFKNVLRYHLGVKIPEPHTDCGLRVEEHTLHWREGQSLLFDDNFEHEAWNRTDGTRVVLIVDVLRPLPFPIHQINHWFVRNILGPSELVKRSRARLDRYSQEHQRGKTPT